MSQEELSRALATAVSRAVERATGEAFQATGNPRSVAAGIEARNPPSTSHVYKVCVRTRIKSTIIIIIIIVTDTWVVLPAHNRICL